ncbi:MAG: DUF1361 domain-containing protein [Armatimonadota bacterium]
MWRWVGWNLLLAVTPVVLGYGLAWLLGARFKYPALKWLLCLPLALAWLALLPNTCYLLTEWRHLLFDRRWAPLLEVGNRDREAMLETAKWSLLFLAYSGAGVLLLVLAVRPLEQRLRAWKVKPYAVAPFLFFLVSLGVFLGLVVRLSSWDLARRPGPAWEAVQAALTHQPALLSIVVFAALLWGVYEAADIWVDGVAARLRPAATAAKKGR